MPQICLSEGGMIGEWPDLSEATTELEDRVCGERDEEDNTLLENG